MAETALSTVWTIGWMVKNACDQASQNNKDLLRLGISCMDLLSTLQKDFDQLEEHYGGSGMRDRLGEVEVALQHVLRFVQKRMRRKFMSKLWHGVEMSSEIAAMHKKIQQAYELFGLSTSAEVLVKIRGNSHRIDEIHDLMRQAQGRRPAQGSASGGLSAIATSQWSSASPIVITGRPSSKSSPPTADAVIPAAFGGKQPAPKTAVHLNQPSASAEPNAAEKLEINYLRSKIKSLRKVLFEFGPSAWGTESHTELITSHSPVESKSDWGCFEYDLYRARVNRGDSIDSMISSVSPSSAIQDQPTLMANLSKDCQDGVYATLGIIKRITAAAHANPPEPVGHVADALHCLAARLADNFGRSQEALHLSEETLKIRRHLLNLYPAAAIHGVRLAQTLSTSATYRSDMAGHDEAVRRSTEATDLLRKHSVTAGNDLDSRAILATALSRSSREKLCVGAVTEALDDANSAVDLQRGVLAEALDKGLGSSACQPNLALFLTLKSQALVECGKPDAGIIASTEARDCWRHLRAHCSDTYIHDYAFALLAHSSCLYRCHRLTESLASAAEAANLLGSLVCAREAFRATLGRAILTVCQRKHSQGGPANKAHKLLPESKNALGHLRAASRIRPRYSREYAQAIVFHAQLVWEATEEAGTVQSLIQDALAIYQGLLAQRGKAIRADLADALYLQAETAQALGQGSQALVNANECLALRRELAEEVPAYYNDGLAAAVELCDQLQLESQRQSGKIRLSANRLQSIAMTESLS